MTEKTRYCRDCKGFIQLSDYYLGMGAIFRSNVARLKNTIFKDVIGSPECPYYDRADFGCNSFEPINKPRKPRSKTVKEGQKWYRVFYKRVQFGELEECCRETWYSKLINKIKEIRK